MSAPKEILSFYRPVKLGAPPIADPGRGRTRTNKYVRRTSTGATYSRA